MTKQNDLKKQVRERMAKTGERYTAARRNLVNESPKPKEPSLPKGWGLAGENPSAYTVDVERADDGALCACVRSRADAKPTWSTLMQSFSAGEYVGARLRFSARVRTTELSGDAKLWSRVDERSKMLQLHHSTGISADADFTRLEIVFDVDASGHDRRVRLDPRRCGSRVAARREVRARRARRTRDAADRDNERPTHQPRLRGIEAEHDRQHRSASISARLDGNVWLRDVALERVELDVATTPSAGKKPAHPTNLDFSA